MERNIILNIDINSATCPFLFNVMKDRYVKEETLYPFVDQYIDLINGKETQIGAIAFNTFCQFSSVASKYMTDTTIYAEKKLANGDDVSKKWYFAFYRMNHEFGIEPWGIWIKRCKERGVEAWLSLRMNDAHDTDYEECLKDEFAFRAKWNGYAIGDKYGYYWKCLDYAYPEVRERFLGLIEEQLFMYDVDALELDFMREIWCFDYLNNPDCFLIMNDFLREVKKIVLSAEEKYNHKIKLSVRLPRDIKQCKVWGFDVETWNEEKLVDHITVTPRWSSSDSDMPINEWINRFPNIEIAAGIETLLRFDDLRRPDGSVPHLDADMVNGLAANYFSQGAKQINLYNYFNMPITNQSENCADSLPLHNLRTADVLSRSGDIETVLSSKRRHVVMYQDIVPEGFKRFKPLPLNLEETDGIINIQTGKIPHGAKAQLHLGFSKGCPESTRIFLNGSEYCDFVSASSMILTESSGCPLIIKENAHIPEGSTLYKCQINLENAGDVQTISFAKGSAEITHAEIIIE